MQECRVVGVYDYPVKGAAGRACSRLRIDPAIGVVGDRRLAFKKDASLPDAWAPKSAFFVGMNTALMVAQTPSFTTDREGNEQLDPGWLDTVAKRLGIERLAYWIRVAPSASPTGRAGMSRSSISPRCGRWAILSVRQ